MNFSKLAERIEEMRPECSVSDIAQLSIMAVNLAEQESDLDCPEKLFTLLKDGSLRLKMSNDHHAAVKDELKELAQSDPKEFKREQIWTLIRAINVQDQLLQMYGGLEPLDA